MSRGLNAGVMMLILATVVGEGSVLAATKPLNQLPADVARWSTLWVAVPKDMVEVGREHGPLAALTWGPAKGMTTLVRSTASEIWDTVKPDKNKKRSRLANRGRPTGAIFRYEF